MPTIDVTDSTFKETVNSDGIVLVDAWASWCGPCRQFGPIFEKVSENHPDAIFAKLDTDANPGVSTALQIQSIPTLMVFRDGVPVFRQTGALPSAALEDLIAQVENLDMDEVRRQINEQ